ncbi:hypothetical protein C2U70_30960 [Bradyrhizobium guangdongense]|uniref:hypothetical protein n=1 Tax=Bradyrhizobium guangdongense TaxID=1325090 RepID=UPI0011282641|nr:hypothetical protein [Bradyrhizobium guangdongense]TPQ27146.1 hypothetical protein C2U70_30960 [Bradyrhizobium guangdongense]
MTTYQTVALLAPLAGVVGAILTAYVAKVIWVDRPRQAAALDPTVEITQAMQRAIHGSDSITAQTERLVETIRRSLQRTL